MDIKQKAREISETIAREMGSANDSKIWIFTLVNPKNGGHSSGSNLTDSKMLGDILHHVADIFISGESFQEFKEIKLNGDN